MEFPVSNPKEGGIAMELVPVRMGDLAFEARTISEFYGHRPMPREFLVLDAANEIVGNERVFYQYSSEWQFPVRVYARAR